MSADLELAYAKLAEKADKEKIPSFSGVLARARQRRRRNVSATLAAVVVLAVLASTATLLTRGPAPEPGGKVFVPFDATAGQAIAYPSPTQAAITISDQERSYVMWWGEDDQEWVAVIDLATGKTPWAPISLGKFGDSNGMVASQEAILLLTEQGYDNPLIQKGQDTIIAVDPLTGQVMWTLPYSFNDTDRVLYSDTLVISWNLTGKTEALDLRTGRPKWTVTDPMARGGLNAMRDHRDFESYSGWSGLPVPTDRRVVLHFADGRVQIRDVSTGDVLSERSGAHPAPGTFRDAVIGDNLYWTDPQGVLRTSLTGSDAPQRIYSRADPNASTNVEPCGPTLICLHNPQELVAIDGQGREAWRIPISLGAATFVGGSGVASLEGGNKSAVYDLQGRQLLPPEYQEGAALWADDTSLLIFGPAGITGYSLSTSEGKQLTRAQIGRFCSWNATKLVCPTPTGISVWTYALS